MRLLFSCGDYYPGMGGATSLVDDLACTLAAMGHPVTVLSRQWPGTTGHETRRGYEIVRPLEYEKFEFSEAFVDRSPVMMEQIAGRLKAKQIDTICIGSLDMSALYFLPLRAADAIVTVSADIAREARARCEQAGPKLRVITNSVDLDGVADAVPRSHSCEYFGFVGRREEALGGIRGSLAALLRRYAGDRRALARLAAGARATQPSRFGIRLLACEQVRADGAEA